VKPLLSGVVLNAACGIAGFISRTPIGITALPTKVRDENPGLQYAGHLPATVELFTDLWNK
jgi:hypothetical protein